ncbi:MAG: ADP-glyceromanno-heptose 6-epimerase [Bacteroidota bacterium]
MIVITGALGFIGSCLVRKLNDVGHLKDIIVVDDFYKDYKEPNLHHKFIRDWIHRDLFLDYFAKRHSQIEFVFHLGARTDTTETDKAVFQKLNLNYSKAIWNICAQQGIPLIYASSAATYGNGAKGYLDTHDLVHELRPLNAYGQSKNDFDQWVLQQEESPPFWAGLKFFNVYGPNEYHKNRMASVIYHTVQQIQETGKMQLFRSHKKGIADGEQKRDFVYIKDVVDICHFLFKKQPESGLYNVGTGQARSFFDLATYTFEAIGRQANIEFIDMPKDIRKNYQYFTEADMGKLQRVGYKKGLYSLEKGIGDYVKKYLKDKVIW